MAGLFFWRYFTWIQDMRVILKVKLCKEGSFEAVFEWTCWFLKIGLDRLLVQPCVPAVFFVIHASITNSFHRYNLFITVLNFNSNIELMACLPFIRLMAQRIIPFSDFCFPITESFLAWSTFRTNFSPVNIFVFF